MWKIWAYLGFCGLIIIAGLIAAYYSVTGDIAVCKTYYKEMSTAQCYFSRKTVRVLSNELSYT